MSAPHDLYGQIIDSFYDMRDPLRAVLLKHCTQVRDKALQIAANPHCADLCLNTEQIICGAMLHDIGIIRCHAPSILCNGTEPYIRHGILGGAMLREYGEKHKIDLEIYARICERHTGAGLSSGEISRQNLPLPDQDFLPETPLEKLICLADKFFSKSGDMKEKSPEQVRHSLEKFGSDTIQRYNAMCKMFFLEYGND